MNKAFTRESDEDEDDDVVPAGTNNHKLCRIADPDCEACQ